MTEGMKAATFVFWRDGFKIESDWQAILVVASLYCFMVTSI